MCGLVGVVGAIDVKKEKVFRNLLQLDVVRGPHSTGAISVRPVKGRFDMAKAAMLPDDFMQMRCFKDLMAGSHVALMGHNRYATIGAVNGVNAHPFENKNIVGMHNGTLTNWRKSLIGAADFDVDSECLLDNIGTYGADDVIPDVEGAWALTWYDKLTHTISFLRNDQRPLWFATSEDKKTLFYASEPWMIQAACWRNEVKITAPEEFRVDTLYEFDLPQALATSPGKPRAHAVEGFRAPPPKVPAKQAQQRGRQYQSEEVTLQLQRLKSWQDQEVTFSFHGYKQTDAVRETGYLFGNTHCYYGHEVRMWVSPEDAKEWEQWLDDFDFIGKVRSVIFPYTSDSGNTIDGALAIDPKSVDFTTTQPWNGNVKDEEAGVEIQDDDIPFDEDDDDDDNVFQLSVRGPNGRPINKSAFDKLTEGGCANCGANIFYGDNMAWTQTADPICEHCISEVQEDLQGAIVQ